MEKNDTVTFYANVPSSFRHSIFSSDLQRKTSGSQIESSGPATPKQGGFQELPSLPVPFFSQRALIDA